MFQKQNVYLPTAFINMFFNLKNMNVYFFNYSY